MIYNDINFEEYVVVEQIKRSMLPSRTIITKQTSGIKSNFLRVEYGVSQIMVDVRIIQKTREDVQNIYDILSRLLALDQPASLILRDKPGRYNLAILSGDTELTNFLETGFVQLTFECPDPHSYNQTLCKLIDIGGTDCLNKGSVPTYAILKISLSSPISNLTVTLTNTQEQIIIPRSFLANDIITIDLESEDVWLNDNTYIASTLDSDFFTLPSGFFNIVSSAGKLDINFRERWY